MVFCLGPCCFKEMGSRQRRCWSCCLCKDYLWRFCKRRKLQRIGISAWYWWIFGWWCFLEARVHWHHQLCHSEEELKFVASNWYAAFQAASEISVWVSILYFVTNALNLCLVLNKYVFPLPHRWAMNWIFVKFLWISRDCHNIWLVIMPNARVLLNCTFIAIVLGLMILVLFGLCYVLRIWTLEMRKKKCSCFY
jgi:hypothetical protein